MSRNNKTIGEYLSSPFMQGVIEECYDANLTQMFFLEEIKHIRDKLLFLLNSGDNTDGLYNIFAVMQNKLTNATQGTKVSSEEVIYTVQSLVAIHGAYINYLLLESEKLFDLDILLRSRVTPLVKDNKVKNVVSKGDIIRFFHGNIALEVQRTTSLFKAQKILLDNGFPIFDHFGRPYYFLCWHPQNQEVPVVCAIEDDDIGSIYFKELGDDENFNWDEAKLGLFSIIIDGEFILLDDFEGESAHQHQ